MTRALLLNYKNNRFPLLIEKVIAVAGIYSHDGSYIFIEPIYGVLNCCELAEDKTNGCDPLHKYETGIRKEIYTVAQTITFDDKEASELSQRVRSLKAMKKNTKEYEAGKNTLIEIINKILLRFDGKSAFSPPS
jgi:hypothetical protein